MGKYINADSKGNPMGAAAKSKVDMMVADGAQIIPQPQTFQPNLVCVVDNGPFGAAAYAYNEAEFKEFTRESDYRSKTWLIYEHAETLAE
jgi:hypothetical protein